MARSLNAAGSRNAHAKVSAGDVSNGAWSFTGADGDKMLGPDGTDYAEFGRWHLGVNTDQDPNTKARYSYPFGKNGQVYLSALRAIRSRASAQNDTAIYDDAGRLLDAANESDAEDQAEGGEGSEAANKMPVRMEKSDYRMVAVDGKAEIFIYDFIGDMPFGGGVSADRFRKDIRSLGSVKQIDLRLHSDGGDPGDAIAMYGLLMEHPARVVVHVDGRAASAASLLAMAGNQIRMGEGSQMMIHEARGLVMGMYSADDMERMANYIKKTSAQMADVYAKRSKQPVGDVCAMMAAETWMSAAEAHNLGFADVIVDNPRLAALALTPVANPKWYSNLPVALRPGRTTARAHLDKIARALESIK